jgi:hypothetical protein
VVTTGTQSLTRKRLTSREKHAWQRNPGAWTGWNFAPLDSPIKEDGMTRSLIIAALALAAGWTNFAQAQDANCPEGEGGYVGAYGAQWSGRRPHTGGLYGDGWSCLEPRVTPEDLFYNYYTAANCGAWPAAM